MFGGWEELSFIGAGREGEISSLFSFLNMRATEDTSEISEVTSVVS